MPIEDFEIVATDGILLRGHSWIPEKPPIGVVCLVHGLGEHIGRWGHVADFFGKAQFAFLGVDLRGHGRSEGIRGHTKSLNQLLDDVEDLLKVARREYNDLPIILYGHSMGGNLVANFLQKRMLTELTAAVLTSPWLKLAFQPSKGLIKLGKIMSRIWPSFQQDNGLDPDDLSTDEEIGINYKKDPLVHSKISARMGMENLIASQRVLQSGIPVNLPVLIMHGQKDMITSAQGSMEFHAVNPHSQLRLWEGLKHELHNEVIKDEVLSELTEWCLKQVAPKYSPQVP